MKRYRKEALFFAVLFVVAIVGLMQLFHEEAYALWACSSCSCEDYCGPNNHPCFNDVCACWPGGPLKTCDAYCEGQCEIP